MFTRKTTARMALTFAFTAVLLLVASSHLYAQSARARIVGTVSDPQGAVLSGATVTVTNVATGSITEVTTDREGFYQALELPIGTYKLKVSHSGFQTSETDAYTLEINQVLRVDVKLPLGTRSDVVEITGAAAQVETVNPTLGASVTARPIVDLPLNGRNVLDLATLEPGVTPHNPDDTSAGTYNIAGARSDSVTFLLDGGVDNNLLNNAVVFAPNPDAVQEFRILNSNDYFEANRYFNNKNGLPRETLSRNQFGGTLGGPFIKDKLFWFVSYQGQRQTQAVTNQVDTFTPEMLAGNFSHAGPGGGPDPNVVSFLQANPFFQPNAALAAQGIIDPTRIDAVAQKYIAAKLIPTSTTNTYICPADPADGPCSGSLTSQSSGTTDNNEFTAKMDYNLTGKDHFTATAGGRRQPRTIPFSSGPGFSTSTIAHNYFSSLTYTRTINTNMLNEFHFTLQRNVQQQAIPLQNAPNPAALGVGVTPDQSTGPTRMSFAGNNGLIVGFSPQGPTSLANNTFVYDDTFSWVKGRHTWKFGGSY